MMGTALLKHNICGELRELARDRRCQIWRGMAIMGGKGDESVRIGDLS